MKKMDQSLMGQRSAVVFTAGQASALRAASLPPSVAQGSADTCCGYYAAHVAQHEYH